MHTSARDMRDTDWSQVLTLYDQLVRLDPSPTIALNRAIAIAELDGPQVALAAVDRLEQLAGYHACHATRATCCGGLAASRTRGPTNSHRTGRQRRRDTYLIRRRDQLAKRARAEFVKRLAGEGVDEGVLEALYLYGGWRTWIW